jgi:hypothetical protein
VPDSHMVYLPPHDPVHFYQMYVDWCDEICHAAASEKYFWAVWRKEMGWLRIRACRSVRNCIGICEICSVLQSNVRLEREQRGDDTRSGASQTHRGERPP